MNRPAGHGASGAGRALGWGAVERTGRGRDRIGLHLWRLGSLAPRGRELRDVAPPHLEDLLEVWTEPLVLEVAVR